MRRSVIQQPGYYDTYRYGIDTYDHTKLGLGNLMIQNDRFGSEDRWVGPYPVALARPMEQATAIASVYPFAIRWQNNASGEIDWVFFADNAAAAATRRINAYSFNRRTALFTWQGFVTVTYPVGTNITIRAQRMAYDLVTTGTVTVSETSVTGNGTSWQTEKACVGNRIGFGSTDPSQITTWYQISAIGSDTSITLTSSAGTIAAGTSFVIEDLRCIQLHTNATTTNGGIFVIKGLSWDLFSSIGGTVPAATTTDNIRAAYWLKDAATITHTVGFGMGLASKTDSTTQLLYSLDTLANPICFVTNVRAALTLTSGAATNAFQFKTGSGGAITGTPTQTNNGRLATASHGPYGGVSALYFTTATRIYSTPVSNVTTGSTTWLTSGSVMTEVPPGGVNTFAASGAMGSIEYSDSYDRFVVTTNATSRNYVTQFRTDNGQMDRIWGVNTLQLNLSAADASAPNIASQSGGIYSVWSEGSLLYVATTGTTSSTNRIYALPFGADWEFAEDLNSRVVFPAVDLQDPKSLIAIFTNFAQVIGGSTGLNLGLPTEPGKVYYRTSGITDNSGTWTEVDCSGLSSSSLTGQIQIAVEFKTIGTLMIPGRVCSVAIVYDDQSMSEYWQGSSNIGTDLTNKRFGFRHAVAYGGTVPRLKVTLYDAESGASLGSDDSQTQAWTWEKSTNAGGAWGSYNSTDRANSDTYLRITPSSLADNIKVRAELTEY